MASSETPNKSINAETLGMLKREDAKMAKALQFVVPVSHGGNLYGPSQYTSAKDPDIWEKANYSRLLTGEGAQPVVSITEEDVKAMKDKAWLQTLWDFDQWVGAYLRPSENPANKALLAKLYPEWLERQKEVVDNFHDFKKKVEAVKIMGPKNKEDLFLLYRLGYPAGRPAGTNTSLAAVANAGLGPGVGALGTNGLPAQGAEIATFQRGIFNQNSRQLQAQSLNAIWPAGVNQQGNPNNPHYAAAANTPFNAWQAPVWL